MQENIDEEIKITQRAYLKEWRKKNPELAKKYRRDYWKRRTEKRLAEKAP